MTGLVNESVLASVFKFATSDFGTSTVTGALSAFIMSALMSALPPIHRQLENVPLW
ncbi:hypothetical protein D3C81_1930880 [compost metagenome]|nr:hypothetical protein LMG19282_02022 [Cupriavidus campinensis]